MIFGIGLIYNKDTDARDHFIMSDSSDKFYIKHHNSDDSARLFIKTDAFEMGLATKQGIGWKAGEWIHIQAYWYNLHMSSLLKTTTYIVPAILVNGQQSESTYNGKYQNLTTATDLFVGNKNGVSNLSANGTIDELKIYDEFWSPSISSVMLGGTNASIISWSDTQTKAIVPNISSGTKNVITNTWVIVGSNPISITIGMVRTISNADGYWEIIGVRTISGEYTVWTELPGSNLESQEYNIEVLGATAFKNQGLRAMFIALSAAYLAVIILFFAVRKKLIAQQR